MHGNQVPIAEPGNKQVSHQDSRKWEDYNGSSPISAFFNEIYPLRQEIVQYVDEQTFPFSIRKGKFLISPFKDNNNLYFIISGVIRGYIREDGKEITTWINEEKEVVGSIRNLGLQLETDEYLQALEDTTLIGIPKAMIEYLYAHFPETNIIGRIVMEEYYRRAEERAYLGRIPSADKKYKRFMETNSSLINRIPLKYIASYLGMTLETLSRVRAKNAKEGK